MPSHYQLCLSRVLQSQLPPKAKLMASPNVLPQTRNDDPPVAVSRTQLPLLPRKQCTLHGVQGKTAEPGLIAHWTFPVGLSKQSIWLAYYVILSRPTGLANLLSFGLPNRDIIEGGPPEEITLAFDKFFTQKIIDTKAACARARAEMGWAARRS